MRALAVLATLAAAACASDAAPPSEDASAARDAATHGDAAAADGAGPDASPRDAAPLDPTDAALARDAGPADAASTLEPTPVGAHRDRLLDGLVDAARPTRCDVWRGLDEVQKGVFLTITDLLGRRSWMREAPAPRAGADLEVALDHVERLVAVLGTLNCSRPPCCGGAGHRVFFVADPTLIAALRDTAGGLPMWGRSLDLAGPHAPFTADSETQIRQPTGQAHFFARDEDAVELVHEGVAPLTEARLVEIDIDYDVIHDSNPVCEYVGGTTGFDRYTADWSSAGAGGAPDFGYTPAGC